MSTTAPTGDLFCACGCGAWLGQCVRPRDFAVERYEPARLTPFEHEQTSPASRGNSAAERTGIVERDRKVGDPLVYTDEHGVKHNALVTNWWGPQCCNLLFVVDDAAKKDPYGQQIERRSSSVHRSMQQAPGNYWQHPDEVT